jgi:hypothetical protein
MGDRDFSLGASSAAPRVLDSSDQVASDDFHVFVTVSGGGQPVNLQLKSLCARHRMWVISEKLSTPSMSMALSG